MKGQILLCQFTIKSSGPQSADSYGEACDWMSETLRNDEFIIDWGYTPGHLGSTIPAKLAQGEGYIASAYLLCRDDMKPIDILSKILTNNSGWVRLLAPPMPFECPEPFNYVEGDFFLHLPELLGWAK